MKILVTSLKRSPACTATLSAHNPAAGHHQPMPPLETLDTPRQVWISLLWGHYFFLLGPGAQKILSVPSNGLFPQSCGTSTIKPNGLQILLVSNGWKQGLLLNILQNTEQLPQKNLQSKMIIVLRF